MILVHPYGRKPYEKYVPDCTVEVLTPDFRGDKSLLKKVFNAKPEIFSHNVECVERISKAVRSQADWKRSLNVLRYSSDHGLLTKTGIMVGLGETFDEVIKTMEAVHDVGVSIFTIGQYLQPTKKHLPVKEFITPDQFKKYETLGLEMGFMYVESGALVRSSYKAHKHAK